jgi:CRISPR-associated protein Csd2
MSTLLGEGKPGYDIYVEVGLALNAQHKRAYAALSLKPGENKSKPSAPGQEAGQPSARQMVEGVT